jgi:hypothetical protein
MFKVGEKIVFINDNIELGPVRLSISGLVLNKIYTVRTSQPYWVSVEGYNNIVDDKRFVSLLEYRKLKIKKICSKLEKK